jgi:hypothetical protein
MTIEQLTQLTQESAEVASSVQDTPFTTSEYVIWAREYTTALGYQCFIRVQFGIIILSF